MDEFERTIAELETLFTDPEFKESVESVRLINTLLADDPTSETDAKSIIKDLNKSWREKGYYGKEMHVTGGVHIGGSYGDVEYSDLDRGSVAPLKSYPFISNGFSMVCAVVDSETGPQVHQRVVMTGRLEYDDDGEESIDGKTNEACAIELTPDTFVEFRELTTPKAIAWLELYYPDTKLLIDECVMQAEDESDVTMNLRDTRMPSAEKNNKEARRQKQAIQVYIDSLVEYELYVPYLVELIGECKIFDPVHTRWEDKTITSNRASMLVMQELTVEIEKKTKDFVFFVKGLLVTSNKSEAKLIKLPVQSILSMQSGREKLRPPKKTA